MRETVMKEKDKILKKYSTGKNVIIFFIITQIFYAFMMFITIPKISEYSEGMKIFDLIPTGYSVGYAEKLLEALGETGRNIYLFQQIPLDMFYPLFFAITYSLLLYYLFKKIFKQNSRIFILSIVPVLAGLFDYLENIGIISMLLKYPEFSPNIAKITNIFSLFKSFFTTMFFVLLIGSVIIILIKKVKKRARLE